MSAERLCQALARLVAAVRDHTLGIGGNAIMAVERAEALLAERRFRYCRACGCSELDACEGGCSWAGPDVCTACVDAAVPHV